MENNKTKLEPSWKRLLEEAEQTAAFVKEQFDAGNDVEAYHDKIEFAEMRYLQTLGLMRIWEEDFQFLWIEVIVELIEFYLWQGRQLEAVHILETITALYTKMRWDFESRTGWSMLLEQWMLAGEFERALDLVETIEQKKVQFLADEVAAFHKGEARASYSGHEGDASTVEEFLRQIIDHDLEDLDETAQAARELSMRSKKAKKLASKIFEPVSKVVNELFVLNGEKPIRTFDDDADHKGERAAGMIKPEEILEFEDEVIRLFLSK